ncbi:MAG: hypothetical protein VZQ83_01620 [Eubacterium sp.]|nr:hypothetical protein [Eubacterium sp.]
MYLSQKYRPLTQTLIVTTLIQVLASLFQMSFRLLSRKSNGLPDMLDNKIWWMTIAVDAVALVLIAVTVILALKKIKAVTGSVAEDDKIMMRRLQEDTFGKNLSELPADLIYKLVAVWGAILVGVGIVQEIVAILYRRFASDLVDFLRSGLFTRKRALVESYNSTHGFKYLAMLVALLLGMVITAILLEDKRLLVTVVIVAGIFLLAFSLLDMTMLRVFDVSIGIVWTSVIFHVLQTLGMVGFVCYLRVKYKGV